MQAGLKKSGLEELDLEKAALGWGAMGELRDEEIGLDEGDLERSDLLEDIALVENAMGKVDRGDAGLQLKNAVPSSDLGEIGPEEDDMKEPGLEVVEFPKA